MSRGLPVSVKACQARCVNETEGWATLLRFRQELYDGLGLRQDSLFELMDAVLTAPQRSTLVRLSLTTVSAGSGRAPATRWQMARLT